jgi:hypothetical protein
MVECDESHNFNTEVRLRTNVSLSCYLQESIQYDWFGLGDSAFATISRGVLHIEGRELTRSRIEAM